MPDFTRQVPWDLLPSIGGLIPGELEPYKFILLNIGGSTLWEGVLLYHRPKAVEATRYVALLGSAWASGSDLHAALYDRDVDRLIRRVESDEWFTYTRFKRVSNRQLTHEWEDPT